MKLNGVQPLVICYSSCTSFLARFLAPWRYGSSNMAYNGKNRKFGQNGPHSCFHISMVTARILPTKDAIDTWDSGPNICLLPTLMVTSSYFPPWRENHTQTGQNGNIPQIG